jgi:hypothetical protein
MAAGETVTTLVDRLVALFNERSMDIPDGCFTRHTRLLLNGIAFEEMLGRSPNDPLVLMIARGAAGYRFTAKAVQHAIPDARIQRGELHQVANGASVTATGQCWLSGHYRGTGEAVELLVEVQLQLSGTTLDRADARIDEQQLQRLREARLRD